ncbi:MAG: hypothetical protein IJX65_04905 [Alistipes sp.]|nr:hypothetical protein [Alistipes sp.]
MLSLKDIGISTCVICGKPLLGSYRMDKWGQKVCMDHDLTYCANCGRIVKDDDMRSSDGRAVCSHCVGKVVRRSEHVEWVYQRVCEIFERNFLVLPEKVPVEIVNAERMRQLVDCNRLGALPMGLASMGGIPLFGMPVHHKVYMLDCQHKVNFGGVLAHELLHVWQNQRRVRQLPPKYCEGFCNLGSYLFYGYLNNELSQRLMEGMMNSPDPIYGEGFREVKVIFETEGEHNLEKTMDILVKKR